uniref:dirigent protein 4-like n=1 Tax=Erigeron canadensis TaxID=72917 RepID=UPI001CB8BD1C|nr:dirigent protein 4-like [Erigeron canadensis]
MIKIILVIFACLVLLLSSCSPAAVKGKYYSKSVTVDAPTTVKKTNLHFFMHDILSGNNPTAVLVAAPNGTVVQEGNVGPFGAVYVFDDPLTVTSDPKSEVIGTGRGLYASVSRQVPTEWTLLFNADLEFTSGEFNGSSICLFSRDLLVLEKKELSIVGGRGKFRMANGFIMANVISFNATSGDVILEFHVTVFHQ